MNRYDIQIPKPKRMRIGEGMSKEQFIEQITALAKRGNVRGIYVVLFEGENAHGYQHGLEEDEEYKAVGTIANEHAKMAGD